MQTLPLPLMPFLRCSVPLGAAFQRALWAIPRRGKQRSPRPLIEMPSVSGVLQCNLNLSHHLISDLLCSGTKVSTTKQTCSLSINVLITLFAIESFLYLQLSPSLYYNSTTSLKMKRNNLRIYLLLPQMS